MLPSRRKRAHHDSLGMSASQPTPSTVSPHGRYRPRGGLPGSSTPTPPFKKPTLQRTVSSPFQVLNASIRTTRNPFERLASSPATASLPVNFTSMHGSGLEEDNDDDGDQVHSEERDGDNKDDSSLRLFSLSQPPSFRPSRPEELDSDYDTEVDDDHDGGSEKDMLATLNHPTTRSKLHDALEQSLRASSITPIQELDLPSGPSDGRVRKDHMKIKTTLHLPLDWTLKSSLSLTSKDSFEWCDYGPVADEIDALHLFNKASLPATLTTLPAVTEPTDETASSRVLVMSALYHWIYPVNAPDAVQARTIGRLLKNATNMSQKERGSIVEIFTRNSEWYAELSGDQETFGMFHGLLRDSMTPLLRSIQHWLNGEQINPSVDLFSNDFWESGYSFQADISEGIDSSLVTKLLIPSFFKADDLDMILYIGKAVRILECANGLEALNDQSMNTTFAETLTTRIFGGQNSPRNPPREATLTPKSGMAGIIAAQFPLWTRPKTAPPSNASGLHHSSSSVLNSMWNSTDMALSSTALTTNFQWLLDRELTEAIKGQYARINRGIHDTMTGKCRLWWHIEGMCSFYLMMNGEIMNDFSLALFKKLMLTQHGASASYARRQLDLDSYSLGAMFSNLAEQHRWPMRAFATVRHHSSAEIQKSSKSLHPTLGQIEDVEFDYMVLDAQRKEFEHELKKRQGSLDLDELVRFTTAFVRTGHERLFLGSKALPLLRSFKGLLELTLDFTKWMTKFLAVQDQRAMMDEDEGIATAGTATAAGRSSLITRKNHRLSRSNVRGHAAGEGGMSRHRVSFGASQIHRHTAGMADSDEDDEAEEDEEEDEEDNDGNSNEFDHGDEERGMDEDSFRHLAAEKRSHDDESHSLERAHEDIEMAEVPGRVPRSKPKKQKTSLTSARGMQEEEGPSHSHPQQQRQEQQQQKQQQRQQQRRSKLVGENEDQYFMSKLQELEHELIRRKRFLADNLKIIVQSNVAKKSSRLGDTAHRGSNGRSGYDDESASPQESGSSYLQGLIYALS
ncbi:hypothetical protein DFQ26_000734 [Actinomortierella ambigua]|nr:hypothetical protein DFQ26_000734 [Actinomortierella ambigua]